jgi:tetratricopeptide (TPR) repeat protein
MIGGEPGIGKTRLTEAVLAEAARRGCLCLVGHSYEMEGAPPYVPFVEILEHAARVVPAGAFRHALGDHAPELAKLMPELRRMFPDLAAALDVPAEQQRWLLFNAYRDFLLRASEMSPTVIVLEDLHWADEPTLQLLLHLSPAIGAHPIVVAGTYRDVELNVTRPFANVLETMLRERRASRMTLRRLHQSGVGQMLDAMSGRPAPQSLAELVHRETEGNPFFVEEVFQHLRECGQVFDASGNWRRDLRVESLDVPESVRLVIGRRLARLSETARRVLTTAAVVGRSFSLALLEALETNAPDAVIDAVEEAERAHLVAPLRIGREARYQFAHELIRQTLAETLSLPRRQRLHLRVAEAIERLHAAALDRHAPALAHHLYQAGAAADPDNTTRWLVAAASEATAAAAHEDALRHLDNALSLWEGERSPRVADLAERRGRALRSLGRPHEAIYALHRAVDLWEARESPERLAAAALSLLGAYAWQAEPEPALEVADAVLARLIAAPPAARFPIVQMRAVLLALSGRIEEALPEYAAATALCEQARLASLNAMALSVEPHFRWIVSDLDRAAAASRAAAAALDRAHQPWMAVDVAWVAPFSEYFLGRMPNPDDVDALIARAERVGHAGARSTLLQVRTALALSAGDLDAAESFARGSSELSRESSNRWGYFSMLLHGLITLERGRVDEGLTVLQDAVAWEPESYWVRYGYWTRFLALAQVAPAEAAALWTAVPVRLPTAGAPCALGAWGNLSHVVLGLTLLGRRDEVAPLEPLTDAQVAAGIAWPMWMSLGRTVAGVASGCAGHWDAAEAHFQAAIAYADAAPHRHTQPDARYWHADMLLHRDAPGDRERARQLLGEAVTQAESMGLVQLGRRIRALAERAG